MKKQIIGVMAIAMLLVGALIAPATADDDQGNSCPQSNGWVKVDSASGSESGDWGTLDWSGPTADYEIEAGYQLELCIKSGSKSGAHPDPWISGPLTGEGSVTTGPDIGGEEEQGISHIAYRITELPPPPTHTVSFTKVWEGDEFDDSDVVVTFDVDIDGTVDTYNDGEIIEYENDYELVGENVSGFPEGDCSWEQTDERASSSTDSDDNTAASYEIVNTVDCDEEEEETLTLALVKDWEVTDEDDLWDEDDASATLLIDGVAFDGTPVEVEEGQEVDLGEEDVVVPEGCEAGDPVEGTYVVDPMDADEDGLITLFITNEVECSIVLAGTPEVEPEPETVTVEVEVLGESIQAKRLPETGASTLLLALLGLTAMGSGGAILRRR